ncbi:SHOCT domain-containing protein [uncultured Methanobrevibacter sp.]|uniref:SHOCT domain-containing protein n=1 Tax=uncultured Methanobrevibacter sp. TaxID=253161 RepID=UPI0026047909|nr:SHOCT domain-containing protein [uncultured Methanobrevibacter sp.]
MGLFDNKTKEDYLEEMLADNNVFEGIKCEAIFPNKQLQIATSSGLKKGVATLAFGLIGLAATSGVKHEEKKRKIITTFQIVEKGIVFKKATENGEDLRIPYENIIKVELLKRSHLKVRSINSRTRSSKPKPYAFKILLLKNQEIVINIDNLTLYSKSYFINHIANIINERACGAQYEEAGWGLEHATNETPQHETKQESNLMDELERLANLYEKGLLTDEEFAAMKKKLIEG